MLKLKKLEAVKSWYQISHFTYGCGKLVIFAVLSSVFDRLLAIYIYSCSTYVWQQLSFRVVVIPT